SWPALPVLEECVPEAARSEGQFETNACSSLIIKIMSELCPHIPGCHSDFDNLDCLPTEKWSQVLRALCGTSVPTLYCPRVVLEVVAVLRKVSARCQQVSDQVVSSAELRHQHWMERTLRSRQRQNYLRMLKSIKLLSPVLYLILLFLALELVNVHAVQGKTAGEYQQYLKTIRK
uniref:Uncharacterized protein n=1 Tax=Loxodonta africana TaxID=9785 RepID=G3U5R9_LOXAF